MRGNASIPASCEEQSLHPLALSSIANERVLLLLGAPRSGTTWAAKVFDSHPQVLYRHEPDISLRAADLPYVIERAKIPCHLESARAYLQALLEVRSIKAVGSRPSFPKDYGDRRLRPLRSTLVAALRLAEIAKPLRPLINEIAVPDLLGATAQGDIHLVLKSVSSGVRARLFAEALPGCRVIFLIRHPGGQVASMLRGARLGKFSVDGWSADLLESEVGRRYGLSSARHMAFPLLDQMIWNWVLYNETIIDDLADLPTARVARHQDLVRDPLTQFSKLFGFAGLSWTRQTEEFIRRSTTGNDGSGYYSIQRNSAETLEGWRTQLSAADQDRIRDILRDTAIGRRWPDLLD